MKKLIFYLVSEVSEASSGTTSHTGSRNLVFGHCEILPSKAGSFRLVSYIRTHTDRLFLQRVNQHELGDAVVLDADANVIKSPFTDLESLPFEVAANLKRSLKNHKDLLGDSVARAFLQALVHLIGGYRDALKFRQVPLIVCDMTSLVLVCYLRNFLP